VLPPASHQKRSPKPKTHLLIFAPPPSTISLSSPYNVTNTNTRKPPQDFAPRKPLSQDSIAHLTHTHNLDTHTARRYLSQRSLKTLIPLQNPFPKVTPVPPSLCPSKISRPTVSSRRGSRNLSSMSTLDFVCVQFLDLRIPNCRISSCTCICCRQATC
jgi:hypothetical protein